MQILRYANKDGVTRYGKCAGAGEAIPLTTGLFDPWKWGGTSERVSARLAPIEPPNIIAIGRNYQGHAKEMKAETPETDPLIFLKATTAVIGPDDSIVLPRSAPEEVDFEAELGVIIARTTKDVGVEDALGFVLGYTCANDVSARDCQKRRDKQWARGKSFDTFCPIGPVIVPRGEFDPTRAGIRSFLNGRLMQESNTGEMIFSVAALVSYLSHQFTLLPGTIILTGTPEGVGAARTPPVFLRPGDEICVEIDGIGRLSNRVIAAV